MWYVSSACRSSSLLNTPSPDLSICLKWRPSPVNVLHALLRSWALTDSEGIKQTRVSFKCMFHRNTMRNLWQRLYEEDLVCMYDVTRVERPHTEVKRKYFNYTLCTVRVITMHFHCLIRFDSIDTDSILCIVHIHFVQRPNYIKLFSK